MVRRPLSFSVFFAAAQLLHGQCGGGIDLGPDLTLCAGSTVLLNAGPGYQSYLWQNGSTAQTQQVSGPGTYQCTVTAFASSGNLVVNGNFSAGITGFTSSYTVGTGGPWGLVSNEGTYAVANAPSAVHSNFASFGDHTTGNGAMLVVNGSSVAGQSIWCQTIAVQPNTDYAFSAWLATAFAQSPAQLVFNINGAPVGNPLLAPAVTGQWAGFYAIWNSGSSTTATICIVNQNTSVSGNDFALDDIAFAPFCTYTDEVTVTYQDYPAPDLGPDVSACAGTTVLLDATWPGADAYAWSNGAAGPIVNPGTSGIYWVDVTTNGCTARDSVAVTFTVQPQVDLGLDQSRCAGEAVLLNASFPGASYQWSDGSTSASITVTGSGSYAVVVDVAGCTASDAVSLVFHPLPLVSLGRDTALCAADSLWVDVGRPGGSYAWSDGSTAAQRALRAPGVFWVDVTELGCTTRGAISLGLIAAPEVDLGPDFLLCKGLRRELDAFGTGYRYAWSTGDTLPGITIDDAGTYAVTVSNACGEASDAIVVRLDQCDCPVFVPNAITADADGRNDAFRPVFDCPYDSYLLQIFNRWGELIWESDDAAVGWDAGGPSADAVPDNVYCWRLQLRPITVYESTRRELRGHVVVLR
jgi:hypothetical protein